MTETIDIDVLIIGAGAVGLAIAEAISRKTPSLSVALIERSRKFGQEISSHNSEVIHAGIYYPQNSSKARHCSNGRDLIYTFCKNHSVPFKNCGKFIVATRESDLEKLGEIERSALTHGVSLERLDRNQIQERLGHSRLLGALWSQHTGIIDSHEFMEKLESKAIQQGVMILYQHSFQALENTEQRNSLLKVSDPSGIPFLIQTKALINSAGLSAGRIASLFFSGENIEIKPCVGRYFSLASRWVDRFQNLIYPIPDPAGGLGVHLTFDLSGRCKLGPDVHWVENHTGLADDPKLYKFDEDPHSLENLKEKFLQAGRGFLEGLELSDLSPGYIGVRPKLFLDQKIYPDFLIKRDPKRGTDWHLLGIESPGLTGALSIAEEVSQSLAEVI